MSKLKEAFFESLETPKLVLRKFWLCRYCLLFAFILIVVGPIGTKQASTIMGNGFLLNNIQQMAGLTAMCLISATLMLKQMVLVFRKSHLRFEDINERPLRSDRPLNWSWLQTSFIIIAGFTLPLTCWLHSMREIGGSFSDDPDFSFEKGFVGLLLGVVVYFVLFLLTSAAHNALDPKEEAGPILPMAFLESIRSFLSVRFRRAKLNFQPDHFELLIDFIMLTVFYAVFYAYTVGTERTPEDMFTSPFFLVLMLTILSMLLSAASYFLDYYRVPTLMLVLLLLMGGYFFSNFDHRFPVVRVEKRTHNSSPDSIASKSKPETQNEDVCIIVVAPGGGIHASAWTGKVLTGLHERYRDRFASRLKLISAVSGGAVGAMFYLDHFPHLVYAASPPTAQEQLSIKEDKFYSLLDQTFRRSSTSSLESLAWGAAFPDTARLLLGNWIQEDRGMVQERRWLRRMDIEGDDYGATLFRWKEQAQSALLPYVVFNATEAETGRRVLFSTFQFGLLKSESNMPSEARAIDFLTIANNQFDLPISTAVRLSATFPYAAAAAMPAKDTLPLGHIVDGGYVDNEGLLTALDFIRLDAQSQDSNRSKQYVLIRIQHTPPVQDHLISPTDPGLSGSGWEYASFGPLMAMSNVRATSQRERGEKELTLLKESFEPQHNIVSVVLEFSPPAGYKAPPLNWKLSPKQRSAYLKAWEELTASANRVRLTQVSQPTNSTPFDNKTNEHEGLEWLDWKLQPESR